jgi:transcriptional regulator with XRE-family HTH domain
MELKTSEKIRQNLINIGTQIRAIRASQGFNQLEFAREVGLNKNYLGGVERGQRNISALNLIKIAKTLAVPVGEFFKGIE